MGADGGELSCPVSSAVARMDTIRHDQVLFEEYRELLESQD